MKRYPFASPSQPPKQPSLPPAPARASPGLETFEYRMNPQVFARTSDNPAVIPRFSTRPALSPPGLRGSVIADRSGPRKDLAPKLNKYLGFREQTSKPGKKV